MTAPDPYREHAKDYRDVWEWDIVLMYGDVRVIGRNHAHLDRCGDGFSCKCGFARAKLSSAIVDSLGRRLSDSPYEGAPVTGDARPLLDASDGTEIPVLSGKTYRLNGPLVHHDSFSRGSIWIVYAAPVQVQSSFLRRFLERWSAWRATISRKGQPT